MPDDVLSPEPTAAPTATEPHPQPAEPVVPTPAPAFEADVPSIADEPVAEPEAESELEATAEAEEEGETAAEPAEPAAPPEPESNKRWYAVKVQSGREDSIRDSILRRVKIEALEEYFGQILIPVERVQEIKNGKRVVKERKKFPGYLMAEVEYNDRILYLFRETSGVGDFVGGSINRPPPPLGPREIQQMLGSQGGKEEPGAKTVPDKPLFEKGDRVKVKDGIFAGMEGEVKDILEAKGQVRVELTIFGRPTSVELEYWQVEEV